MNKCVLTFESVNGTDCFLKSINTNGVSISTNEFNDAMFFNSFEDAEKFKVKHNLLNFDIENTLIVSE